MNNETTAATASLEDLREKCAQLALAEHKATMRTINKQQYECAWDRRTCRQECENTFGSEMKHISLEVAKQKHSIQMRRDELYIRRAGIATNPSATDDAIALLKEDKELDRTLRELKIKAAEQRIEVRRQHIEALDRIDVEARKQIEDLLLRQRAARDAYELTRNIICAADSIEQLQAIYDELQGA